MPPGGMPPGGAGQPPNRKGLLIGLAAGGAALVLVAVVTVVILTTRTGPAYAGLPGCDDLLPEDALARIGDLEGTEVDESPGGPESGDDDVVQALGCTGAGGGDEPAFGMWAELFDPATRDDDYRKPARFFEDQVEDLDDQLEDQEDGGSGSSGSSGSSESEDEHSREILGTEPISVGDEQRAFVLKDSFLGEDWEFGTAVFRTSNVIVGVTYYGDDEEAEEKARLAVELAEQVDSALRSEAETA
ncbi:hypothetical protein [Nocardiopsis baichengensis]|uniref:hypothetical protein n=1 Tax=Nocardiopsis baichengensis TaxID=280240 RepID=UPI001EF9F581|nr:hypothetical protein [Nocardiopsis baichengensis]